MFDITTFSGALMWVMDHGYILMFLAMLVEGPVVTAAASFAVALGYFSLPIVFILSLFGDLVADIAYYLMGYYGRFALVDRFGHRFGLSSERIKKIEDLAQKHSIKTLLFLKLMPVLPTPGLMAVGAVRMPIKKFILWCTLIILPKTIFFMIIGYYFGATYNIINQNFELGGYVIFGVLLLIILVYYIYNRLARRLAKDIEKL